MKIENLYITYSNRAPKVHPGGEGGHKVIHDGMSISSTFHPPGGLEEPQGLSAAHTGLWWNPAALLSLQQSPVGCALNIQGHLAISQLLGILQHPCQLILGLLELILQLIVHL